MRLTPTFIAPSSVTILFSVMVLAAFLGAGGFAAAQENGPGPLTPPPEHKIERVVGVAKPEAPPSLPPAQIIAAFAKKEDLYQAQRPLYSYKRSIKIQELGPDGRPMGEFNATYQGVRSADG